MSTDLWWHSSPGTSGDPQLLCLPFLGGYGGSYHALIESLTDRWDVWTANPPGHGTSTLPVRSDLRSLLADYRNALVGVLRPGAVVFGHSMGGLVGLELVRGLGADPRFVGRVPRCLVVSACAAPSGVPEGYGALGDEDLLRHLLRSGALPPVLAREASLIEMFLPAFRADYRILDELRVGVRTPVAVDCHLVLAEEDALTPPQSAAGWRRLVERLSVTRIPEAEHMYVQHRCTELAGVLASYHPARDRVVAQTEA